MRVTRLGGRQLHKGAWRRPSSVDENSEGQGSVTIVLWGLWFSVDSTTMARIGFWAGDCVGANVVAGLLGS